MLGAHTKVIQAMSSLLCPGRPIEPTLDRWDAFTDERDRAPEHGALGPTTPRPPPSDVTRAHCAICASLRQPVCFRI